VVNHIILPGEGKENVGSEIFYHPKQFSLALGLCRLFGTRLFRQESTLKHLLNVFHRLFKYNGLNMNRGCQENTL
jgi:hypothetical protein